MRYAIIADIHGNLPALEAVLEDIQPLHVDGIWALGDLVMRAPYPKETLDLLLSAGCTAIRGNVDGYLFAYEARLRQGLPDHPRYDALNRWTFAQLGREGMDALRALPEQLTQRVDGAPPVRLVHGSPGADNQTIVPDGQPETLRAFQQAALAQPGFVPPPLDSWFAHIPERVLVCGHSHMPWVRRYAGLLAFNPGSAGVSTNGDPRACYALLTWDGSAWQVEHRAVPYDLARLKRDYEASGLLQSVGSFARAFLLTMLTGQNVAIYYVYHSIHYARSQGYDHFQSLPESAWSIIDASFPWEKYEA